MRTQWHSNDFPASVSPLESSLHCKRGLKARVYNQKLNRRLNSTMRPPGSFVFERSR
jgi:hypothetical protein